MVVEVERLDHLRLDHLVNTAPPSPLKISGKMRALAALAALLALLATARARPTPSLARWLGLGLASAGAPAPAEEGELWALLVAGSNG